MDKLYKSWVHKVTQAQSTKCFIYIIALSGQRLLPSHFSVCAFAKYKVLLGRSEYNSTKHGMTAMRRLSSDL